MDEITKRQVMIMKKRRTEMGFTQTDVAEEAGISLQQYQNFEYGKRKIANCSTIMALRICAALELDPYELVFENGRDYIKRIRDGLK
ncbi:MAG: helix-turn-helix transcriptional regulator [Ruminococcus flavefaciens]|nr:helix-turn-helix transcriptional regulator [Ruminococcus sp.]MDD6098175.1 helix-turn-helix transcriptional regulator [Oscillospiraceae bacterium]